MQVKLVRHTPEPEKTVAMSARLCYSPIGAAQLEEKISDEQAAALVEFEDLMQKLQDAYNKFTEMGIPAEDARYVLPNAAETKIVCTFNARSLLNFFSLRCCMRAQWEIRALAEKMLAECKRVAPVIFENAGPTCVSEGICREGAMSCGRLEAILKAKKAAEKN